MKRIRIGQVGWYRWGQVPGDGAGSIVLAGLRVSRTGPERLTLITCGGGFDRVARSYLDNIVVTAVPA